VRRRGEGIETEAQRDILAHLGCPRAQGFLFGRPGPPAVATRALDGATPRLAAVA
jgi:EAL domain-containing protein (putative c-di-GMP-specific phosphodiesterase class I)